MSEIMSSADELSIKYNALVGLFRDDLKVGQENQTEQQFNQGLEIYRELSFAEDIPEELLNDALNEATSDI